MSNSIAFFKGLLTESILNLHTAMPCKVLSFDESSMRAKIQPLFMMKEIGGDPEPFSPIEDVPVLYERYKVNNANSFSMKINGITQAAQIDQELVFSPSLKAGDVVLAVFCQRAIDDVLNGKIAYPEINRAHDIQDAVIVGVIT
ncbi:hypothetical protein AMS60_05655 [Bacillus sp. FJAT-21945]|nr:hypothetical protein AMS60_05655 [Bacillus sp. FJAT-21945]